MPKQILQLCLAVPWMSIAKYEPYKEIRIKYFGDLDPSGDDMGRDLPQRIESISAKLNIDEFVGTTFVSKDEDGNAERKKSGKDRLEELTNKDPFIIDLQKDLEDAKRDNDYKDSDTGEKVEGRNTILDQIRIRKSELIARSYDYTKKFPHLKVVVVSNEQEANRYRNKPLPSGFKLVFFERVAVTEDQIIDYDLPDEPRDQKTMDKLENDPRYESHLRKYGRLIAAEVDALDALYPDVLGELVQKSYDDHYDPQIYKKEILDPYGSKKYKKETNDIIIEKLEALVNRLKKRKLKDFQDEELTLTWNFNEPPPVNKKAEGEGEGNNDKIE
jgi:hypothetical protein